MTGVSVCLNRGDVDPKAQQVYLLPYTVIVVHAVWCIQFSFVSLFPFLLFPDQLAEAAGSSLVSIIVDHIFLCIKDTG
jgi:hypothetical protein